MAMEHCRGRWCSSAMTMSTRVASRVMNPPETPEQALEKVLYAVSPRPLPRPVSFLGRGGCSPACATTSPPVTIIRNAFLDMYDVWPPQESAFHRRLQEVDEEDTSDLEALKLIELSGRTCCDEATPLTTCLDTPAKVRTVCG